MEFLILMALPLLLAVALSWNTLNAPVARHRLAGRPAKPTAPRPAGRAKHARAGG